jgi:GT2 family glycosyltransferase
MRAVTLSAPTNLAAYVGAGSPANVDAIVVNRDRAELLLAALRSVREALAEVGAQGQTIVADNGSTDHSAELIARELPDVRWIQLEGNNGFPAAVNAGLEHATAEWVLLLNNDATIDRHAIRRIMDRPIPDDVGTIAMQMRFTARPDVVNSAGLGVDVLGITYDRYLGAPAGGPGTEPAEVFGACGGAALYRRAMLEQIGRFDGDYFLYFDDADVAWRSRMAGWRALYVPDALVWHDHSATTRHGSSFKYFYVGRSRVRLLAKNADRRHLLRYGAQMLAYDLGYVVFVAITDRSLAPLRGRLAGLREWRRLRAGTAAWRRPVELDRRQGFRAALRRRRAWSEGARRVQAG